MYSEMKDKEFRERINDKTKSKLSQEFIDKIYQIAVTNFISVDFIWDAWEVYVCACELYNQSPVIEEFMSWNGWE